MKVNSKLARVTAEQIGNHDETEFTFGEQWSRDHASRRTTVRVRNVGDLNKEAVIQFTGEVTTESHKSNFRTTHFDFNIPQDLVPLFLDVVGGSK